MSFKTGLLRFDDDPRKELEEKVLEAAVHYRHKYSHPPDTCCVHPGTLAEKSDRKQGRMRIGNQSGL
jgi:hypothetical protein